MVEDVLSHYLMMKEPTTKRRNELASRAMALLGFWGGKTLDDITTRTCRDYVNSRTTSSQARRELEDLRAACRMAIADNVTRQAVTVTLPRKPRGRVKHLPRADIAKLILAAHRKREVQKGKPTSKHSMRHVARFILTALYTGSRSSRIWQASFVKEPGLPFIDLAEGVFYRAPDDEDVAANKQAPPVRLPARLLAHMRRWHKGGPKVKPSRYVCEYQGRPADPKRAFRKLVTEVFGEDGSDIVRHTMRHTSATWLMQAGADKWQAAGYLGMTLETLEKTYGHHHPDHQSEVGNAFSSGRAGRARK